MELSDGLEPQVLLTMPVDINEVIHLYHVNNHAHDITLLDGMHHLITSDVLDGFFRPRSVQADTRQSEHLRTVLQLWITY